MRVLTFIGYYLPGYKGGGPIKTIKNLVDQVGDDLSFKIITGDRDLGDIFPYNSVNCGTWNKVGSADVLYIQPGFKGHKQIIKVFNNRQYDIVYLNSFFSVRFSFIPMLIAKVLGQKIVLGPKGEFSGGALSLKAKKKKVFVKLYKALRLYHGTVFQASSEYEAKDIIRVLGPKVDVFIAEDVGSQEFLEVLPVRNSNVLNAVFVSRISPMKNLLAALEILQEVKQSVSYHIYGPVEDADYWDKCEAIINMLPKNIQVEYKGELKPEDVVTIISAYDIFFMPTKGENYGHVIAEALCAGLPLLISDATPWRNLQEQGIGWDLSLSNPNAFSAAIDELALMSLEEHRQMRENVLEWARKKFSQRDAIDANIAMFEYAANK